MNQFEMKHKNRLITITCLVCFITLATIAFDRFDRFDRLISRWQRQAIQVTQSRWQRKALEMTPAVIKRRMIELNFSYQKDDLLDILEVPIKKMGPEVPQIILQNPSLCSTTSSKLNFVIYVHSFIHNWNRRQALRRTYANPKLFKNVRFQVIFFLGLSKVIGVQEAIKKEFDEYGDIVQGDFIDAYRNMTLKAIFALSWLSNHCSEADYALKIDDDTFLNLFEMISVMQKNLDGRLVVICPLWLNQSMPVLRDRKECMKWCVSFRQFRASAFPQFCSGLSYTLSGALVRRLVEAVERTPFFWIDDVYITGLLMKNVTDTEHVRFVSIVDKTELDVDVGLSILANTSLPLKTYLFHTDSVDMLVDMWQLLLKRLTKEQWKMIHVSAAAAVHDAKYFL